MSTTPIYNMTDTWNDVATSFTAVKMDVTDTASADGSLLLDLAVGGTSKFKVDKDGFIPDTIFGIADATDRTKRARFNTTSISTGTTRAYDLPDYEGLVKVKRHGPLDLYPSISMFSKSEHYWVGNMIIDSDNTHWMAVARTYKHTAQEGAVLQLYKSDDGMNSWDAVVSLTHDKDTEPRFQILGNMHNGRQGIMYALFDNANAIQGYQFVYSDNDWSSWTRVNISDFGGNDIQFYGEMLPYPASVGGSDTGGYIIYGYAGDPANIVYVYTTDNGLNWTFGTAINNSTGDFSGAGNGLTEPSVAIMTSGSRYVMACRNRDATGSDSENYPVVVSTSEDMTTWTTPVEIGELPLGSNPVIIMCEGGYTGKVHIYASARQDSIDDFKNALMHSAADASDFFDADGDIAFPPYSVAYRFANEFTGYLSWDTDTDGNYYAIAQGAESTEGSENPSMGEIYALTPFPQATFNSFAGELLDVNENLFDNPTFNWWTDNTTFTGTDMTTADRWKYVGTLSATVTRQDVDADIRKHVPGNPLYAMRVTVSAGSAGNQAVARQEWQGREQMSRFAGENITVQMWFTGSTPDTYSVTGGLNFGTGGSPTTTKTDSSQMTKFEATGDGLRYCEATISMPPLEGNTEGTAPTFGSNNDEYAYIEIHTISSSWAIDILALKAEFGDVATEIIRPNPDAEVFVNNPLTAAELQQLQNIGSATFSSANWTSLETYADNALDAAELQQLQNIGANAISAAEWGYVAAMDQSVETSSTPTFAGVRVPDGGAFGGEGSGPFWLRSGGSNRHAWDGNNLYLTQHVYVGTYTGTGFVYVRNAANTTNEKVVGYRGSAVGKITTTASSGTLPTADGAMTIADAASPTNAELLEYCVELEAKVELLIDRLGASAGHGLTAD